MRIWNWGRDLSAVGYGKKLFEEIGNDDVSGAAAELAYRFFLALFPFVIFLASLGGFVASAAGVDDPTEEVMQQLETALPEDASSVVRTQLESIINQRNGTLLSIGIIGAIWSAASGVSAIMKVFNRAYEVRETRPVWKRYGISVGLTVLGGLAILAAFLLLVVGQVAGQEIAEQVGLSGPAGTALNLARWPVVFALIILAMAVLYWATPNVDLPFKWITPGAVVFAVGWLVATYAFGLYVSNFASYNATYGALAGVVILLFWFYITSFLLVVGAEINALVAQEAAPEHLPQTEEEGATPETIPQHRRAEARALRSQVREPAGSTLTSQQPPRRNGAVASKNAVAASRSNHQTPATVRNGGSAPQYSRLQSLATPALTAAVGLFITYLTISRLSRSEGRKQTAQPSA